MTTDAPPARSARHRRESLPALSGGDTAAATALRARKLVLSVARHHFGEPARQLAECGGGLTNAVYRFKVSQGEFVARTHEDSTKFQDYLKEQWAMDAARAVGVPTPRVLEVGSFADGRPYMISERVHGIEGRLAPKRLDLLEQMGQAAAKLHTVRTHGFGSVFDWSTNTLSKHGTWAGYLAKGFGTKARIDILARQRMLTPKQAHWLEHSMAAFARCREPPVLHHGDLRLKNVIVDPASGRIAALIDWEGCASMPGPAWDLSLALHDLGIDGKEAFLRGYGIKRRRYLESLDAVRCFNMLNYAHAVGAAAVKKDKERLAWLRVRLAGQLDLFRP